MRIGNIDGRLSLIEGGRHIDVSAASGGRFEPDPQAVFSRWSEFRSWAAAQDPSSGDSFEESSLGAPAPAPINVLGVGLNYRDHAEEGNLEVPDLPLVFTKLSSTVTGPFESVQLPNDGIDYEVELVVVLGEVDGFVAAEHAWSAVAGLTVGQDLSDRALQWQGTPPQFSIGKSRPGFSPIGPVLVTPDEFRASSARITTRIGDEILQDGNTGDLIFTIPALIEYLTERVPLRPGDVIFTGTPAGIGAVRTPPRYLVPGETLISEIEGIGAMRNHLERA